LKNVLMASALALSLLGASLTTVAQAAESPFGNWKRPDGSTAKVWECGKKMCAKVTTGDKKGFNMFMDGIDQADPATWKGSMKHPKMGTGMTFNGTVKLAGNTLNVKGCMIGGMMCDAEDWTR
jgi:uncharacterized protein (DUF2147 family)